MPNPIGSGEIRVSGDQSWPPPGYAPPPPGYAPPPPGYAPPPPGYVPRPQVHKPGAVPLRPLGLGDMYDAAFKIIRFNAGATVGSTLLVSSVSMLVPTLAMVFAAQLFDLSTDAFGEPMSESELMLTFGTAAVAMVGGFIQAIGLLLVTGMVSVVAQAAAVGRRLTIAEAWAMTHGRRWRLIGLAALIWLAYMILLSVYTGLWVLLIVNDAGTGALVLWGFVSVPAVIAVMVWSWVRLTYLAVPAMMLERLGVFGAIGRGFRLTKAQFWRTFGIALLTWLITYIASQLIAFPISLVGAFAPYMFDAGTAAYVALVAQALAVVLATAFVAPFQAGVTCLQYVDQRMRKEGYDVELLAEAGITPS
jgi:hypothetical protein